MNVKKKPVRRGSKAESDEWKAILKTLNTERELAHVPGYLQAQRELLGSNEPDNRSAALLAISQAVEEGKDISFLLKDIEAVVSDADLGVRSFAALIMVDFFLPKEMFDELAELMSNANADGKSALQQAIDVRLLTPDTKDVAEDFIVFLALRDME